MEPLRLPTEEEVRAAAHQGEEAAVELVVGLAKNWVGVIQQLEERVQALEDQLAKNSSLRKSSGKKSGGQPGHKGHTLEMRSHSEHVQVHRARCCQHCFYSRKQHKELPPV